MCFVSSERERLRKESHNREELGFPYTGAGLSFPFYLGQQISSAGCIITLAHTIHSGRS